MYSDNTIKCATNRTPVYIAPSSLVNKVDFGSTLFNETSFLLLLLLCRFPIVCFKLGADNWIMPVNTERNEIWPHRRICKLKGAERNATHCGKSLRWKWSSMHFCVEFHFTGWIIPDVKATRKLTNTVKRRACVWDEACSFKFGKIQNWTYWTRYKAQPSDCNFKWPRYWSNILFVI